MHRVSESVARDDLLCSEWKVRGSEKMVDADFTLSRGLSVPNEWSITRMTPNRVARVMGDFASTNV